MIFRILVTNTILFLFIYLCINQFTLDIYRIKTNSYVTPTIKFTRICCLILTAPKYFDTRARAVNVTWGPRCDKYLFISESANNTYNLPLAPIKNLTAGYKHLTQKSTLAFYYTYENLIDQYDWFVKADDDTYLIVENLRSFLREQNSSEAISFGYNFKVYFTVKDFLLLFIILIFIETCQRWLSFRWCSLCFKSRSITTFLSSTS